MYGEEHGTERTTAERLRLIGYLLPLAIVVPATLFSNWGKSGPWYWPMIAWHHFAFVYPALLLWAMLVLNLLIPSPDELVGARLRLRRVVVTLTAVAALVTTIRVPVYAFGLWGFEYVDHASSTRHAGHVYHLAYAILDGHATYKLYRCGPHGQTCQEIERIPSQQPDYACAAGLSVHSARDDCPSPRPETPWASTVIAVDPGDDKLDVIEAEQVIGTVHLSKE